VSCFPFSGCCFCCYVSRHYRALVVSFSVNEPNIYCDRLMICDVCDMNIGADLSTTEMARVEGRSSKGGVLVDGTFPLHHLGGLGSVAVSSPGGVRKEGSVIWRFRTFYRLTVKAAAGVDFADVKFLSVKFSLGSES